MKNDWKSLIAFAIILFGFAYIGLSYVGFLPDSMKNFVTFLQTNMDLFAFLFCFTLGSFVLLKIVQSKRTVRR